MRARGGRLVVVDPRRSRTAEEADVAPRDPAGHRRAAAGRHGHHARRGGPASTPGDAGAVRDGASTTVLAALDAVHPRGGGPGGRRRRRRDPPAGPRARRRARPPRSTAASAPPPPSSARSPAGWSTCSTSAPATSTGPGGAMFTRRRPARRTPGRAADRAVACGSAAAAAGSGAWPRPWASCRRCAWPRRSTRPARARSGPWSPSPATRCCPRPNGGRLDAALGRPRVHGRRRHLRERDHPPRRRDPARRRRRSRRATTTWRCCSWRSATSPTTRRRCCRSTDDQLDEWEILARLALIVAGHGRRRPTRRRRRPRDRRPRATRGRRRALAGRTGRDPEELLGALAPRRGPERLLDLMLRTGPYGDGFGAGTDEARPASAAQLDVLLANPHGVDLGPLEPRLPDVLRTPIGHDRAGARADRSPTCPAGRGARPPVARRCVLVGRRDLRSNNSWMHNVEVLVKGKPRCTLHVHPDDAARLGLGRRRDGAGHQPGRLRSRCPSRSPTGSARAW